MKHRLKHLKFKLFWLLFPGYAMRLRLAELACSEGGYVIRCADEGHIEMRDLVALAEALTAHWDNVHGGQMEKQA
jgi:hypothetical protein